jgi:NAD(P)H dehydrogenase (quinone)
VVRHGDFDAPETLPEAFSGAETVLVNGTNYGAAPERRGAQRAAAIDAARAAGAERLVVVSWQDLDRCPLAMATDFPGTERLVIGSGTILRMTYGMAASLARDVQWARIAGELVAPAGNARATPAATGDLAEATANVLLEGVHDGKVYDLSGPDPITWDDLAALAGEGIAYRPVTDDEEYRAHVLRLGFPAAVVDGLNAYYAAFRAGWANTPTADLARLLHRAATPSLEAVRQAV